MRLLFVAQKSTTEEDEDNKQTKADVQSKVYAIIRQLAKDLRAKELNRSDILNKIIHKGYDEATLNKVLEDYEEIGVWTVSKNGDTVRFLSEQV